MVRALLVVQTEPAQHLGGVFAEVGWGVAVGGRGGGQVDRVGDLAGGAGWGGDLGDWVQAEAGCQGEGFADVVDQAAGDAGGGEGGDPCGGGAGGEALFQCRDEGGAVGDAVGVVGEARVGGQ